MRFSWLVVRALAGGGAGGAIAPPTFWDLFSKFWEFLKNFFRYLL